MQDYLYDSIAKILETGMIAYVKWDFNRNMAEVGSALLDAKRQREIPHRYYLGLYALLERLVTAFPDVLFESCSGGGGRFDAGMLYYMPRTWTSDNSDAIERLKTNTARRWSIPSRRCRRMCRPRPTIRPAM